MSDQQARLDAVRVDRSVIVQAPAGSGKTTLLVERYLGLLGIVSAPEEILAITFTRKAAAEMRDRVLRYLDPAFEPAGDHEQAAWQKAKAIRERVDQWQLLANPNRLLIRTIDSFNHYLARTMPVASALGPVPVPADNTQALHRQAARKVLALVDGDDALATDLARLLDWRDHQQQRLEDLLANMLAERDQWQRALEVAEGGHRDRQETVLNILVGDQVAVAAEQLNDALDACAINRAVLLRLLQGAAANLLTKGKTSSPITVFAEAQQLPGGNTSTLPLWRGLAELLITQDKTGAFRTSRGINASYGFDKQTDAKTEFLALFEPLREFDELATTLHQVRSLPEPTFDDADWEVLEALIRVLMRAAAELELVFARTRTIDYPGLAAAALRGLGDERSGFTDLGLYLDQRIAHILVDEFQDTNWSQLRLLEQLTGGWEPGDGRSLFLVGDPMQSIYRFREAEVGLFIRSRDQGIGAIHPDFAALHNNFRSRAEIVDWVNERLGPIFPTRENVAAGAVTYAPSTPARAAGGAVMLQAYASPNAEAQALAAQLATRLAEQQDNPDFKAAVIVRARSHLRYLLPALAERGIGFRAVKLDPLLKRPVVQDLIAIARAICQPADRAACFAVLRSPPAGLTLADLHALATTGVAEVCRSPVDTLSVDGQRRAAPVLSALLDAQQHWQARPLRSLVEATWQRLGGPECCANPAVDLMDADAFLDALEQADSEGLLADWNDFMERLERQFTQGDPPSPDVKLEVLTMHGAKGLEWDLVVLPALERRPPTADSKLLHWVPFSDPSTSSDPSISSGLDGGEAVLLAPLRKAEAAKNGPLIDLIRQEQQRREQYEIARLLYVALTRAQEQLILSCCIQQNSDVEPDLESFRPVSGSLLAHLWSTTAQDFRSGFVAAVEVDPVSTLQADVPLLDQQLRRVANQWQPTVVERTQWTRVEPASDSSAAVEFNWAGVQARRSGSVLHRLLEAVGKRGVQTLDDADRQQLRTRIPKLLSALGTGSTALADAATSVASAFDRALDSRTGQWLLSNEHTNSHCELALSGWVDGQLINAIIDRTFVDADGTRWIVDYKTGFHEGADLERFYAEEARRYRAQLTGYRRLFEALENRPIQTALYLPRHDHLEVVDTVSTNDANT